MNKILYKAISAYGAERIYERFAKGRSSFPEQELVEWVTKPFPEGLGIPNSSGETLAFLLTELCFPFGGKKIVFADGMYHEKQIDKRTDEGDEIYIATQNIVECLEKIANRQFF
uniref:Uncharacterized protein n=1 Tax=Marseillevirus sp. TaxID=2809551 RepID=A0AA96EL13_9VIRU|nr:hypothetical protein MarFTMF_051 [Marseillevirus sp.]